MTNNLKIADVEQILCEIYGSASGFSISRKKGDIILSDLTGQSRSKHKALGNALKTRGLKCNHVRTSTGTPSIIIFNYYFSSKQTCMKIFIEDQEKQGQEEFINSIRLPRKINFHAGKLNATEQYSKMGIEVLTTYSKENDLFLDVKLPEGWRKKPTDHSMWSDLFDDKGRKRALIFYKAAFYDRSSFINFLTRYTTKEIAFASEKNPDKSWDCAREVVAIDLATQEIIFKSPKHFHTGEVAADQLVDEWLTTHYPEWNDINAYW